MYAEDRGETLIELVVAVMIMGIALVAILGGVGVSILMSDIHRKQATAGAYVRDYAEAIENVVASGGYLDCATTTTYGSPAGFAVPSGYEKAVVAVKYWDGTGWRSSCSSDTGLQQVTLQINSDDTRTAARVTERLVVVLRKP
jgi:prepilin-type N-terminal cleavage/methylation domain-containing protein